MSHSTAPAPAYAVRVMVDGELIDGTDGHPDEAEAIQNYDLLVDKYGDGKSPAEYTIDVVSPSGDVIASTTVTPWADVTQRDEQGYRIGKADSITVEDEASAEDDDAPGFNTEPCSQCGGIIAEPGIEYVEDDGQLCDCATPVPYPGPGGWAGTMHPGSTTAMDEWHAQDGDTYSTPYTIAPMPGAPRRRSTAAWPKPALSSVAGLAALRMAVAL